MLKNNNRIIFLILLFALLLRLYGINFEVPHPDDYITVQGAMHFGPARVVPTGYGLYGLYNWPAFSLVYIQIILFTLYFSFGWLMGVFPSIESFRNFYLTSPSTFYLLGRLMSVAFGVGTIALLYYLAKKLYNHKVGVLASLFLSVSFIHSFHSQFIRPDIPSTFLIVLIIICCLSILDTRELKYYIYSGILTGLATATKFTSAIMIIPIFVTFIIAERGHLLNDKNRLSAKNTFPLASLAFGTFILAVSLSAPFFIFPHLEITHFAANAQVNKVFINFLEKLLSTGLLLFGSILIIIGSISLYSFSSKQFILNLFSSKKLLFCALAVILSFIVFDPLFFGDFRNQIRILLTDPNFSGKNSLFVGVDSLGFWGNFWWYIKGPLNWGLGLFFEIFAFLGFIYALARKRAVDAPIVAFLLIYLLTICFGHFRWERYVIPLMPFIALYAAYFIYKAVDNGFSNVFSESLKNMVLLSIAIIMIILPTVNIIRYDYLLTQKDTRIIAKEWVDKNIPRDSKIGQDAYTGSISNQLFKITKKYSLGDLPLSYYVKNKYKYLIVSDTQYKRYLSEPKKHPGHAMFYRTLFDKAYLVKTFMPRNDLWPFPNNRFSKYHIHISPTIKIYRISNVVAR